MSNTYTPNLKLPVPALGDRTWNVANDIRAIVLDGLTAAGSLAVTTHEQPSASLLVDVSPGAYIKQDWSVGTYAGGTSIAVTTAATNYIYLTPTGTLTVNTTGFIASASVPLAVVVAGATTITSVTDARRCFPVVGPLLDGTAWTVGTTSGLQIGTTTSGKLGFFGKTPIVQPTVGAGTAGASYTATEQAMLQAVHDCLRNLGLGS